MSKKNEWYCTMCGFVGAMKEQRAGSPVITIILFFFFIIPALIYSQWRWSNRKRTCPKCGSQDVIPSNSPMAKKMLESN